MLRSANGYSLLKHGGHKSVKIDLSKMLMYLHNTGMDSDKNKQSLFAWQVVPDNPPRPQSAIDFDRKESLHATRYQSQLLQKMNGGFTRKLPADIRAPYKKPLDTASEGLGVSLEA
jgi:hypothetical protein